MTAPPAETKQSPPYSPWSTWTTFLDSLKSTAIPSHIDPSINPKMSGSAFSQVRGVNRFLGAVDELGATQPLLRKLVAAFGTDAWKETWKEVFFDAYQPIVGDLDLDNASLKQLVDRFRDRGGVSGSVLRKSIRFYLDGLTATGVNFSPHFKTRGLSIISGDRVPKQNGKTPTPRKVPVLDDSIATKNRGIPEPSPDELVVQVPGRPPLVIPLPANMEEDEWDFINLHVKSYMKLRKKK